MGRQDLFPVVIFTVVLVAALAAIISINSVTGPWKLPDRAMQDIVGKAYTNIALVPAGYAPPFDTVFDGQPTYLFASGAKTASASTLTVNVTRLPGVDRQYIYKTGKYSSGNTWKDFTFTTPTTSGSNWILNEANFTGAANDLQYGESYVIIYVCKKYQGLEGLKCGPKGLTNSKNWTIQSFTIPHPSCESTQNQFCNTANTSVLPNTTINASASCTGSQVCFKCVNGAVNQSKVCVVPQYTCESTANQLCGINIGNASNTTATGTCPAGQYCYKCNNNFQKNGTRCDPIPTCQNQCSSGSTTCMPDGKVRSCEVINGCLNWSTPQQCSGAGTTCIGDSTSGACINLPGACTLTAGQICGPASAIPTNMTGATGICAGGQSCYKCADGYTFNSATGTCTFNCNSQSCPSPKVCDNTAKTCLPPNCPSTCAATNITCGTAVTSVTGCSQCPAGNGTKCSTAGQTCSTTTWQCQAQCTNECTTGTTQCSGSQVQTCGNYDSDTCLEWGAAQACPTGQSCTGSSCQTSCTNECTTGATQCSGANVQSCGNYDADSCTEWGTPQACPSGQACSGTNCQATCTNECSTGAKECSGNGYRTCGNHDSDACLEWSTVTACSSTQTCSNGQCVQSCNPTTEICDSQDNDCDNQIDEAGVCTNGCTYAGTDIPSQHLKCPNAGCTNTIYADYRVDPTGTQTFNEKYLGACCSSITDCVDPSTNACVAQESKWLYSLCKNKVWYPCYEGVSTMQITIGSQSYKCDAPAQQWFKCGGSGQAPCSSTYACTYKVYNGGAGPTPPKGATWTGAPVETATTTACCALSQCGGSGQCYDEGVLGAGPHWICATAQSQSQAAWYLCDGNNVGETFISSEGYQFCCNADSTPGTTGYKFTAC